MAFAVCVVFYVREARRPGWRPWVPVLFGLLPLVVAVAFAFPLFLGLRELRLRAGAPSGQPKGG